MKTYKNATELCNDHGADNFWRFGRTLYKYTDCGPWTRLVLTEDRSIYYGAKGADDPSLLLDDDIIGIEIGSIVEGSEVEIGPILLRFPFTSNKLYAMVKEINDEASFYWKRDNEDEFILTSGGIEYYITSGWGNEYPKDMPAELIEKFERWQATDHGAFEGGSVEFEGLTIEHIDKSDFTF
jgi:hypothetical protein